MKKQAVIQLIPACLCVIAFIFFLRKEVITAGMFMILAGITATILKRYGGELVILIGIFIISVSFSRTLNLAIGIILLIVSLYDLLQMANVSEAIKKSGKQITGKERLSAYREKELLHCLLKKIIKGR